MHMSNARVKCTDPAEKHTKYEDISKIDDLNFTTDRVSYN